MNSTPRTWPSGTRCATSTGRTGGTTTGACGPSARPRRTTFWTGRRPSELRYPGAPREHLYTNAVRAYYRAPHIFIAFPTRFLPDRGELTEGVFMTSRDGETFHRWGEAIIRPGLTPDRWYNRSNYIWWGLVETEPLQPGAPPELSIYSHEAYYRGRRRATAPLHLPPRRVRVAPRAAGGRRGNHQAAGFLPAMNCG